MSQNCGETPYLLTLMQVASDLPARLGLKDGHSSRLFEARGLYFRWPQPMRKYINVFGR